ncbi:unnamed protein product [Rotaria sordida]|uniref:G-protein coupled receptors family 1 profile domain-containing protein n=1 Tax=Rotaria sordida TaxID=392033 RepID=A0A818YKP2_9BILA|nr:unnamed protein product [Rotaria sordida]CAF1009051.1 unnamed protein product [Rotaria sordida]CAF3755527.1 unnamed protein product [Rotaria sordida]CAF3890299.1 unnamed protein product [Rotaria sordida]
MNNATNSLALLAFIYRFEIITLPILIIFGSICNIMTFIVMRRRRMRVSSTCFYMAALAVTDTLVLWTGCLNQWFYIIHVPTVVAKSNFTCKLLPFLFVFFADASVWIIVCMSFERYFAVSRPLRASQMCTTKRAKWVLLIMFIVFALIDGHFLLTLELEIIDGHYRVCHPKMWARHFVGKIFVFIDALKYSAIPFCILLILSILIIQRVFHAEDISAQLQNLRPLNNYRQYSTTSNQSSTTHSSSLVAHTTPTNLLPSNTRVGRRVTFMLLSVSIAFCIFSAPMSLMQIVQSISKPGYHETPLAIGKAIAELCQYVNHSCNFFLYALTGRIFRREFVRLFFPTRFGTQRGFVGGAGINGIGLSARAGIIPHAANSSSRHGSLYSIENNRYNRCSPRSSRRLTTLYPVRYKNERNQQTNSSTPRQLPFISFNNSPILKNRFHYLNRDKSSLHTIRNNDHNNNNRSLVNFWHICSRKNELKATRDGSILFLNELNTRKRIPSTV